MSTSTAVEATDRPTGARCLLLPMNLHDPAEFSELVRQRVLCGWNYEPEVVEGWRKAMDRKTKLMYWITVPAPPPQVNGTQEEDGERENDQQHLSQRGDESVTKTTPDAYLGHIALQSELDPPEPDLARPDKSVMMLTAFFVLAEHRHGGLGRAAMEALEAMARLEPACRELTLTTIHRRYVEDDAEEWRGVYAQLGIAPPDKGRSTEDWYVRMGYAKWMEAPRYRQRLADGTEKVLIASYLRKRLK